MKSKQTIKTERYMHTKDEQEAMTPNPKPRKYVPSDQISPAQVAWLRRLKRKFRQGYTF